MTVGKKAHFFPLLQMFKETRVLIALIRPNQGNAHCWMQLGLPKVNTIMQN
jgi:hypothetical protein